MRNKANRLVYRYLITTLVVICLCITFFIYSRSENKNFVESGINKNSSWYKFFTKGIENITWASMEENIDIMKSNIQQWLNLLNIAKHTNNDRNINLIIDQNIIRWKSTSYIVDTLYCVQYLKNIAISYYWLIDKYNTLTQKFVALQKAIIDKMDTTTNPELKSCYLDYIKNIKSISDDIIWWHYQLSKTKWYIDTLIQENYDKLYCDNIQQKYKDISELHQQLSWYIKTIDLIISKVNSDKLEDNKSLCKFGTIVNITGVESKIYKMWEFIKKWTGSNLIDNIQNYDQYIEKVKEKSQNYLDIWDKLFKR